LGAGRIDRSVLLSLRIKLPTPNEQTEHGGTIRGLIRERQSLARAQAIIDAAQRSQREFVVTGATVQDRLRQFEDYLLGEQWISSGSAFSVDKIEGTSKFAVRPLRRVGKITQSIASVSTETSSEEWVDWCSSPDHPWRVFNSFVDENDLP